MTTMVEEKVDAWKYQTVRSIIVPYIGGTMKSTLPEDFLVRLYFKLKHDDIFRRLLPDTSVQSLSSFVSYFYGKTMILYYVKPAVGEINELAGAVWLYDQNGNGKIKRASVGVFFFKEYWGNPVIYELAAMSLRWMFEEAKLSIVFGTIAAWNRASVRFGKKLGFKVCGVIPMFFLKEDSSTDMVMVALKPEDLIHHG